MWRAGNARLARGLWRHGQYERRDSYHPIWNRRGEYAGRGAGYRAGHTYDNCHKLDDCPDTHNYTARGDSHSRPGRQAGRPHAYHRESQQAGRLRRFYNRHQPDSHHHQYKPISHYESSHVLPVDRSRRGFLWHTIQRVSQLLWLDPTPGQPPGNHRFSGANRRGQWHPPAVSPGSRHGDHAHPFEFVAWRPQGSPCPLACVDQGRGKPSPYPATKGFSSPV